MSSLLQAQASSSVADPRRPRSMTTRVEEVALVAASRRALLLRAHHFRLRHEDLEDCYGQATLELIRQARDGRSFTNSRHVASVLEQRFLSRINDRRRALAGRSPMQAALEAALPLSGAPDEQQVQIADCRAEPERLALMRHDLRRLRTLALTLTEDQRLVLASQLAQLECAEFCRRFGWSREKYRKVAQRGRMRLRALLEQEEAPVAQSRPQQTSPGIERRSQHVKP
jgi:DNA-directed RNA polymerase specialized sigma24 family protein